MQARRSFLVAERADDSSEMLVGDRYAPGFDVPGLDDYFAGDACLLRGRGLVEPAEFETADSGGDFGVVFVDNSSGI